MTQFAAIAAYPHELIHHLTARLLGLPSVIVRGATIVDVQTDAQELAVALAPLACTLSMVAAGAYLLPRMPGVTELTMLTFKLVSAGWLLGCAHDLVQAAVTVRRMLRTASR